MEIQDVQKNEKTLKEAERIVKEIVQKRNWIPLANLLIIQLTQGMNASMGAFAGKRIEACPDDKEIIAKVRDMLLEQKILAIKYEGKSYDILTAYGEVNGFGHSSCLSPMHFDLGIIARQNLGVKTLDQRELSFALTEGAIDFAEAYNLSHKSLLGYIVNLKLCEINSVEFKDD